MELTLDRDTNGNKIVKIKVRGERAFSIQTNGNLPNIHKMHKELLKHSTVTKWELLRYVNLYGTKRQRDLVTDGLLSI